MNDEVKNVVSFDRTRRRPDPARVTEFAETARRLQRERQESADVVTRMLRDTPREEWPRLATNVALRNSGVLDRLGREVATRLERDPQEALALANLAASIAETLPANSYPAVVLAQMKAHAWKDRARALTYLGRYDEALESCMRAEERLTAFITTAHDLAIARLVKAMALQHLQRFDESIDLLENCKSVFFDHGDVQRFLHCSIVEGNLLFRRYQFRAAREIYAVALDTARQNSDVESQARLHNNLAQCAVEMDDLPAAKIQLSHAMALFNDLGKHVESIRTAAVFGCILLAKGSISHALESLTNARRQFLQHGMVEEAGICGLEIVDGLLRCGDADAATGLAAELVTQFTEAVLSQKAIAALGYLKEALAERSATTATVRQVHGYILALRTDPTRHFAAAP